MVRGQEVLPAPLLEQVSNLLPALLLDSRALRPGVVYEVRRQACIMNASRMHDAHDYDFGIENGNKSIRIAFTENVEY